jgi:hypothetical protein
LSKSCSAVLKTSSMFAKMLSILVVLISSIFSITLFGYMDSDRYNRNFPFGHIGLTKVGPTRVVGTRRLCVVNIRRLLLLEQDVVLLLLRHGRGIRVFRVCFFGRMT